MPGLRYSPLYQLQVQSEEEEQVSMATAASDTRRNTRCRVFCNPFLVNPPPPFSPHSFLCFYVFSYFYFYSVFLYFFFFVVCFVFFFTFFPVQFLFVYTFFSVLLYIYIMRQKTLLCTVCLTVKRKSNGSQTGLERILNGPQTGAKRTRSVPFYVRRTYVGAHKLIFKTYLRSNSNSASRLPM